MSTSPDPQQTRQGDDSLVEKNNAFYTAASVEDNKSGETLRMFIVALALVLFFLTMAVVFVLPRFLPSTANPSAVSIAKQTEMVKSEQTNEPSEDIQETKPAVEPNDDTAAKSPPNSTKNLAQREVAQESLRAIDDKVALLKQKNVQKWAAEQFTEATSKLPDGERAYSEQRYQDAVSIYKSIDQQLDTLSSKSKTVLSESLANGEYALSSGDSAEAKAAFEQALLIDPDNAVAKQGNTRAENLDEVLALVNEGKGFEDIGEPDKALERYRAALELDSKTASAEQAIRRITAQKTTSSFNAEMSKGLKALEQKKYTTAKKHFTAAKKINPNDTHVTEVLRQTNESIKSQNIDRLLRKAAAQKNNENWSEVEKALLGAKRIDNSISGIDQQIQSARNRITLEKQLLKYTNESHRLRDDDVHLEALSLLDKAKTYTAGPKLRGQIATLQQTVNGARTPKRVNLSSDEVTDVTIYKVGSFGSFKSRQIDLLPGKYIAVGKRTGYRDVRVEFTVDINATATNIDVRCTEAVQFGAR